MAPKREKKNTMKESTFKTTEKTTSNSRKQNINLYLRKKTNKDED